MKWSPASRIMGCLLSVASPSWLGGTRMRLSGPLWMMLLLTSGERLQLEIGLGDEVLARQQQHRLAVLGREPEVPGAHAHERDRAELHPVIFHVEGPGSGAERRRELQARLQHVGRAVLHVLHKRERARLDHQHHRGQLARDDEAHAQTHHAADNQIRSAGARGGGGGVGGQ